MATSAPPAMATLGGIPNIAVDVPICSVFLVLYLGGAIRNMSTFLSNRRQGHKFLMSVMLFAFCMIRVVTSAVRISWATHPTNSRLAIAAQVFNNAGILIVYIINLIFAQRVLRSRRPNLGWSRILSILLNILYGLIIGTLIMGITSLAISTNTTDPYTLQALRSVSLAAATFLVVMTVLPLLLLVLAYITPFSGPEDTFGSGTMTAKTLVLLTSTCLALVIAGFKAGTSWESPRLASNPAWFHSKAAFYCFTFMLEVIILLVFAATRVDLRFYVPDGCKGPGDYSRLGLRKSLELEEVSAQVSNDARWLL